jgi:hypothetical protein
VLTAKRRDIADDRHVSLAVTVIHIRILHNAERERCSVCGAQPIAHGDRKSRLCALREVGVITVFVEFRFTLWAQRQARADEKGESVHGRTLAHERIQNAKLMM